MHGHKSKRTEQETGDASDSGTTIRVAWTGRVAHTVDDPGKALTAQLRRSAEVLPSSAEITARFADIGSGCAAPADRGCGQSWAAIALPFIRDGGLADLLAEAGRADRRFDVVVCHADTALARNTMVYQQIRSRLRECGVTLLVAGEPEGNVGSGLESAVRMRLEAGPCGPRSRNHAAPDVPTKTCEWSGDE